MQQKKIATRQQLKHTPIRQERARFEKNRPEKTAVPLKPRVILNPAPARPSREGVVLRAPESAASVTHAEQPVPLLMSGMTLWSAGLAALLLIPMATAALAASPLLLASGLFFRRN